MKKIFIFVALFICFTVLELQSIKADEFSLGRIDSETNFLLYETSPLDLKISDDTILTFETLEDKLLYIKHNYELEPSKNNSLLYTTQTTRLVNTFYPNKVFGGYMTNSWAKSSSYTVAAGHQKDISASYNGISLSYKFTQTITTRIPANANKYSKLGYSSDWKIEQYRQVVPNLHLPRTFYKKTLRNSYISVYYQN